jgi:hypothetical protein
MANNKIKKTNNDQNTIQKLNHDPLKKPGFKVIILLPIETACHYLYYLTRAIVQSLNFSSSGKKKDMLKVITKPFTSLIVKVKEISCSLQKQRQQYVLN